MRRTFGGKDVTLDQDDHKDAQAERPLDGLQQRHGGELVAVGPAALPVPVQPSVPHRRGWPLFLLAVLLLGGAAGGARLYWLRHIQVQIPLSISWSNGRLESDEIDISTKFAGRLAELDADEGDTVDAKQVVARMDTQDLAVLLKKAQAQVELAQKALDETNANVIQQQTQVTLASQEMERTRSLLQNGYATKELFDQRRQQVESATAALSAAKARVAQAQHALDASRSDVELNSVNIADNTLVAPRWGRIQYRLANIGEVLPAGGKVFTMLDLTYVYMDIYLPTDQAGRIKAGADARILLDAYPDRPIPAQVVFVATQAQFTPKTVETASEREKLMFRVRIRIDPKRLHAHADAIKSGVPGLAYIRTDPTVAWPDNLRGPDKT
jgi:HlyD family secretion protein